MLTTAETAEEFIQGGDGRNVTMSGHRGLRSPARSVFGAAYPGMSCCHFWSRRFRTVPHNPGMFADL